MLVPFFTLTTKVIFEKKWYICKIAHIFVKISIKDNYGHKQIYEQFVDVCRLLQPD